MINRHIVFCFLVIFIALIVSAYPKAKNIKVSAAGADWQEFHDIKGKEISEAKIEIDQSHILKEVNVEVISLLAPEVTVQGAEINYKCELIKCVISFWSAANNKILINIHSKSEDSPFKIEDIVISKEKYQSALTEDAFKEIIVLLIIFYPIYFILYKKVKVTQWLLIAVSIYILVKIHLAFSVALACYLIASFYMSKSNRLHIKKIFKPLFIITSALVLFVLFKFIFIHVQYWNFDQSSYSLVVPVGLSYFLLRLIDTQLKWYRGELKNASLREYILFVIFLPTIPAGPIDTLDNFIRNRAEEISQNDITVGFSRILFGIFQKLVLADFILAGYLKQYYAFDAPGPDAFLKLLFTFLFIYIDFSAYSNIAIGTSRLFGYKIIENFNWPILAVSPRDFWKRWHISLSAWCMRNVYFPLVIKTKNTHISVFMVMLTIGMWHAASLTWFLWAIHHSLGIWMSGFLEKYLTVRILPQNVIMNIIRTIPSRLVTLLYICAGYSFAQYADITLAMNTYMAYWESIASFILKLLI